MIYKHVQGDDISDWIGVMRIKKNSQPPTTMKYGEQNYLVELKYYLEVKIWRNEKSQVIPLWRVIIEICVYMYIDIP